MKKFLKNTLSFLTLLVICELLIIHLPTPNSLKNSLYFAKLDKDSLLQTSKGPRIILVGGSNLTFGLNSKLIKDSLKINPINTGMHANHGLIYMMDEVIKFIKKGDLVILVPEYGNFYENNAWGSGYELLVTTLEVNNEYLKLRPKQLISTLKYLPQYTRAKINPRNYLAKVDTNDIYSRKSFNQFGDAKNHWEMDRVPGSYISYDSGSNFNGEIISEILKFSIKLNELGATLLFSFPCTQEAAAGSINPDIKEVEAQIKKTGLNILGTPRTFMFPDSLMFNSTYHLTKRGADLRTLKLIRLLKPFLIRNQ